MRCLALDYKGWLDLFYGESLLLLTSQKIVLHMDFSAIECCYCWVIGSHCVYPWISLKSICRLDWP